MEKFAIDLDKVLDDFELEDENECALQYDKLQLEFCDGHNEACQDSLHGNYQSNGSNWLANVSEVIPGTRSPPDGQHDDNSISDQSIINSAASNTFQDKPFCNLNAEEWSNESSRSLLHYQQENSNLSNLLNNDLSWPKKNSGNLDVSSIGSISTVQPFSNKENCTDGWQLSENNRLDVLPVDFAPSPDSNHNKEGNHPDIIDIKQGNITRKLHRECSSHGAERSFNTNAKQKMTDLVSSTQHDNVLLPDLMFSNKISFPEQSNPAVVTENLLLPCGLIEPSIITENHSASKLSEVTNVYQSARLHFINKQESVDQDIVDVSGNLFRQSESLTDQFVSNDLVSRQYEPLSISDASNSFTNNSNQLITECHDDVNLPRFNSDLHVDELVVCVSELDADNKQETGLKTLYSEPSLNPPNSSNPSIASIEKVDEDMENFPKADASTKEIIVSSDSEKKNISLSEYTDYKLKPTESSNIPSINTLQVCTSSSSIVPREIRDYTKNSADKIEESCCISSGTVSNLMGDFDQNENGSLSMPPLSSQQTSIIGDQNEDSEQVIGKEFYNNTEETEVENNSCTLDQTEINQTVGTVAPFWVPDKDASNCQECGCKFTIIRRRHHCRACGRVLCAFCSHSTAPMPYLNYKEARVCETCLLLLAEVNPDENDIGKGNSSRQPNPNNPMEYCSRIPPLEQVAATTGAAGIAPPPTVMVPVGILKRDQTTYTESTSGRSRANKQVIFMDGIQPGGDLRELVNSSQQQAGVYRVGGRSSRQSSSTVSGECITKGSIRRSEKLSAHSADVCLIPEGGGLPPILLNSSYDGGYQFDHSPDRQKLEKQLQGDGLPIAFAIMKNFTVLVKKIKLTCCIGMEVWNLTTRGLCNVGQDELVILIEALPREKAPPAQLFTFFYSVYQQANKGNLVTELGHTIFTEPEGFLGSKDHAGFLYIKASFQCLNKLLLPPPPYLFAVLIQKWETPWAKVFPLRLMLRLGAEFRYYPCPLVSSRNRKPVFGEIGHTIMNLLVDFRNYGYTIPLVQGFNIHMEDKKTTLLLPRNRYEQVCKALDNSNDHVLALAANFSTQADSHLVTVEDDDGNYSTQAINIHNRSRKVTGASFIVFNGALKYTPGLEGKSSIVEDGLMVQIHGDMMISLRDALRNLKDFEVHCGQTSSTEPEEIIVIRWVEDDKNFNVGIRSPVDDKAMDGIPSIKVHTVPDYASKYYSIRWTEIFIIQEENSNGNNDINISRLSEAISRACCIALLPHLHELFATGQTKVALRTTLQQENVEYEIGSRGVCLSSTFMNSLDTELIPIIHQSAANIIDQPIIVELVFHILEQ